MNEKDLSKNLLGYLNILWVFIGISLSLIIVAAAGDATQEGMFTFPLGWFLLWVTTTAGSIPLGLLLHLGVSWRKLPYQDRRWPAIGFLLVGMSNFIGLTFLVSHASPGFPIYLCPLVYLLLILPFISRAAGFNTREDELFP